MKLALAYSPCPNDTFMFHALATGKLRVPDHELEVHLHDVETLNQQALARTHDVTKLSFHAYLRVEEDYALLRSGAALGYGCGPLVVAKQSISRTDLAGARVAIPGELTTAHMLFRLWAPAVGNRVFVPYDRILPEVLEDRVDCGVIIHESRFVYEQMGLRVLVDLGEWWTAETGLPIPLGCIAARRTLPGTTIPDLEDALRRSIEWAREDPRDAIDYAKQHAQELDEQVLEKHIKTFVNEASLDLAEEGLTAVAKLREMAREAGILR